MVPLYTARTPLEYPTVILPPGPRIHSHHHRTIGQSLSQLSAAKHLIVVLQVEGLLLASSFTGLWLVAVDGAEIGVVLVGGYSICFEMFIYVSRLFVLDALGAAVDDFLLGEGDEGLG
jgi:hypothetical protein